MTEAGAPTSSAPFDFDDIDVGAEMGSSISIFPLVFPVAGPVASETDADDTVASLAVESLLVGCPRALVDLRPEDRLFSFPPPSAGEGVLISSGVGVLEPAIGTEEARVDDLGFRMRLAG